MSAWLKAGLVGVAILIVLNLIGLVPFLGCITWLLTFVAYMAIGVLAASYLPPRRDTGKAAGQGALAAAAAGFVSGIVNAGIGLVRMGTSGIFQGTQILSQLPPETLRQLRDLGVDPNLVTGFLGPASVAICGSLCFLGSILLAAILGAIGAVIYTAVKPE